MLRKVPHTNATGSTTCRGHETCTLHRSHQRCYVSGDGDGSVDIWAL